MLLGLKAWETRSNGVKKGQALTSLVIFTAIATTVITATVLLSVVNATSASTTELGMQVYGLAESGAENALLRLLRDPNYTGETLTIGGGQATMTVIGNNPKTISSVGTLGSFRREIRVVATLTNGILSIQSWREVY